MNPKLNPESDWQKYIELVDLQNLIRDRIGYIDQWVKVEIDSHSEVRGHHYLGFYQKSSSGDELAKARGIIWKSNAGIISEFTRLTGQRLEAGITIVVRIIVQYTARFGLSLIIQEIDAGYSIGQRELEKKETIRKLTESGLMERQKGLALPFLPSHIAVISSKDAAGYGDFLKHLGDNMYGFKFDCTLFQALMQGDRCPASISSCLEAIAGDGRYDLVLILRGGGAESDLFCYDDYGLSKTISECPLPVLTAIGHERDCHIADMVAKAYFKTPTALADFLIDWVAGVEETMLEHLKEICQSVQERIVSENNVLQGLLSAVRYSLSDRLGIMNTNLQTIFNALCAQIRTSVISSENEATRCLTNICFALNAMISNMENSVALADASIKASDPRNILRQGYVLATDKSGTILRNVHSKSAGDDFSLRFSDGFWDCQINGIKECIPQENKL